MSYKAVLEFFESTSEDSSLREAISTIVGVGDGDISSAEELDGEEAQALIGEKGVRVAALAAEKGYGRRTELSGERVQPISIGNIIRGRFCQSHRLGCHTGVSDKQFEVYW